MLRPVSHSTVGILHHCPLKRGLRFDIAAHAQTKGRFCSHSRRGIIGQTLTEPRRDSRAAPFAHRRHNSLTHFWVRVTVLLRLTKKPIGSSLFAAMRAQLLSWSPHPEIAISQRWVPVTAGPVRSRRSQQLPPGGLTRQDPLVPVPTGRRLYRWLGVLSAPELSPTLLGLLPQGPVQGKESNRWILGHRSYLGIQQPSAASQAVHRGATPARERRRVPSMEVESPGYIRRDRGGSGRLYKRWWQRSYEKAGPW